MKQVKNLSVKIYNFLIQRNNFSQSLNLPSIIIIIIIDIFLIFNIFTGLSSAPNILSSKDAIFHCDNFVKSVSGNTNNTENKIQAIFTSDVVNKYDFDSYTGVFKKDSICGLLTTKTGEVKTDDSISKLFNDIQPSLNSISNNENKIKMLETEYNSTLLEKIANQDTNKSINASTAENTKKEITDLKNENILLEKKINNNHLQLKSNSKIQYLINFQNTDDYKAYSSRLDNYIFWYPTLQLIVQVLFLLPIMIFAYFCNHRFNKRNWQVLSTLSWNIFLLCFIPILIKIYEFLQFGFIFTIIGEFLYSISISFYFLISYLYIILIPIFGYLFILILQKTVYNKNVLYKKRIENNRCINCNYKLRQGHIHCTNCGTKQTETCSNCNEITLVGGKYCNNCGVKKPKINSIKGKLEIK